MTKFRKSKKEITSSSQENAVSKIDTQFLTTTNEKNEAEISPFSVVGQDERLMITDTTVGPYCNTVRLEIGLKNGGTAYGSGFVIGERYVATAGHCLYTPESYTDNPSEAGWITSLKVIPAQNGSTKPYGTYNGIWYQVGGNFASKGTSDDDWGVIKVDGDIGKRTGWLGMSANWGSNGDMVYNTGYPGQALNKNDGTHMYRGDGIVRDVTQRTIKGDWDSSGGNSGGPIYYFSDQYGYCAVGILRGGSTTKGANYPTSYSDGTHIDSWLFDHLTSFRTAE